jgi:hypothetical protein
MKSPTLADLALHGGKISFHRYIRHGESRAGYVPECDLPGHHAYWSSCHKMEPIIIALSGPAGSGKSTAAEYLARHHGFARTRFAAPLKAMMGAFYSSLGFTADDIAVRIEGSLKERGCPHLCGKTPRLAMQTLGTEWGREILGASFWVDAWRETAARVLDEGGKVVVEDCRFDDEAIAVRALGGIVIGIKGRGGISGGHKSEAGVDADVTIWNDGTPEILHARLDGILDRYKRDRTMVEKIDEPAKEIMMVARPGQAR